MTDAVRCYSADVLDRLGREYPIGRLRTPIGEATIQAKWMAQGPMEVDAEQAVVLYDWNWALRLELLSFHIVGSGTLEIGIQTDKPTSSTVFTPLGTHKRWRFYNWECKRGAFRLSSDLVPAHATLASEVEDDGSDEPKLWGAYAGAATTHKITRVMVRNPDTEDAVNIERLVVGYT
jgi:hypothetical protein